MFQPYNRKRAVAYAHEWAFSRNPAYYDYENLGGDCTSFISQCVYAGSGIMNFQPTFGWYYINGNQKSPSWSGVPFFYQFMCRPAVTQGPFGQLCPLRDTRPGDIIQLSFDGERFSHSLLIVSLPRIYHPSGILVAAHSSDADFRPLMTYSFQKIRCIHLLGSYL